MAGKETGRTKRELHPPSNVKGTCALVVQLRVGEKIFQKSETALTMQLGASEAEVCSSLQRMGARLVVQSVDEWLAEHLRPSGRG